MSILRLDQGPILSHASPLDPAAQSLGFDRGEPADSPTDHFPVTPSPCRAANEWKEPKTKEFCMRLNRCKGGVNKNAMHEKPYLETLGILDAVKRIIDVRVTIFYKPQPQPASMCHTGGSYPGTVSREPFPTVDAIASGPFCCFSFSSNLANSCIAISSS
jgi:hypothetical protein